MFQNCRIFHLVIDYANISHIGVGTGMRNGFEIPSFWKDTDNVDIRPPSQF